MIQIEVTVKLINQFMQSKKALNDHLREDKILPIIVNFIVNLVEHFNIEGKLI